MGRRYLALAAIAAVAVSTLGAGTASASGTASLNVVHGIPGADVNVCLNGSVAISDFNPGEVVTGVAAPAGTYDVKVVALGDTCGDPAIVGADNVDLGGGKDYTAVAYLDEGGAPTLGLFRNNVAPVTRGSSRLTIRHTAAAPAVDVWVNGNRLLRDVPNGASATLAVPSGVYAAWVSMPGGYRPVIGPAVLKLKGGMAYQVYAWGNATAGYAFAVVAARVGVK
jgi:uncharacterized protein DUF4397